MSQDHGEGWAGKFGVANETVTSADASGTPLVITDAPGAANRIVLTDLEISVAAAMTVTVRTTTGVKVLGKYYLPANGTLQITTRSKKKTPTVNQTLEVITSAAGAISVGACYYFEA
jgi:hypothetical protein